MLEWLRHLGNHVKKNWFGDAVHIGWVGNIYSIHIILIADYIIRTCSLELLRMILLLTYLCVTASFRATITLFYEHLSSLSPEWKYISHGREDEFECMVVVVQSLGCVWLFANPWSAALQATSSFTISWSLLKPTSIESVMLSNYLILCCPLLLLPLIFPRIGVFSNESAVRIRWPKYWSSSFSIGPSNEYSGLISFRIDWFDVPAVQETLKNLLQHHSSKAWMYGARS